MTIIRKLVFNRHLQKKSCVVTFSKTSPRKYSSIEKYYIQLNIPRILCTTAHSLINQVVRWSRICGRTEPSPLLIPREKLIS